MEQSFGITFFRRRPRNEEQQEGIIYLRITVDGECTDVSTKRTCSAAQWNSRSGKAYGKTLNVQQLNAYLDTFRQKVYEAKRKMLELDISITSAGLKEAILGIEKPNNQKNLLAI
jgi:Arm DNA-binding domain